MSRADLLALTPESVAALSNLGLVKRAQREIAAGTGPKLEEDDAGVVTGTFPDGAIAKLAPNVLLRDAPCSCGATTVCRHRVAVALAYPAWAAANAPAPTSTNPAPVTRHALAEPWSPSFFTDASLEALTGKRLFRRAQTILRSGVVIDLEGGATPVAKLPTCTVRFHVPRDLAYARCDCQATIACEHVVLASWAFRRAEELGNPPPCTVELGARPDARVDVDPALADALTLAEHVIHEGVAHLGTGHAARFARVRKGLEGSHALWPGTILDDLERSIDAYRARSARFRTGEVALLLASLAARIRSATSKSELPRRYVLGSDDAPDTPLDHLRLVSLGARVVADDRARDVSIYLVDPDSGIVLVLGRRYEVKEGEEPEDGPALAQRAIAGRFTVDAVARGQMVTRAAKRKANHTLTLSSSRANQTNVTPSSGDWDALRPPLVVRDFEALATDLRARPPKLLAPRVLAGTMRVLVPARIDHLAYRPGEQEVVASLEDANGVAIRLVRRHAKATPHALDTIARALATPIGEAGCVRHIAGEIRLGTHGLEIDPTAIVTSRILVPDLETSPRRAEDLPHLPPASPSAFGSALDRASAFLEEALHDGLGRTRSTFADRGAEAVHALSTAGLGDVAKRVQALALAVKGSEPEAARIWLDAAIRLELTRESVLGVR